MVSDNDEPADLAGFRARREELKRERRRKKARDNFTPYAPDYGREIPPRLNPDVPDMVDRVKACYVGLTQWITGFQQEITELADAGKLDRAAEVGLLEHYRDLQEAVDAATADALSWHPVAGVCDFTDSRGRFPDFVHRLADHAKYVYAVGTRDIAALQYRLAELAGTGRLDHAMNEHLQWHHCLPMWETLYNGTTSAVRDDRTWDGGWYWSDNTYSDGRHVMVQVRVKNWYQLDCTWPYNKDMCGDGAINEHPRGTLCQVYPVVDPDKDHYKYHPTIEIDPEELIKQLGSARFDFVVDVDAEAALDAAMLELSNELANEDAAMEPPRSDYHDEAGLR